MQSRVKGRAAIVQSVVHMTWEQVVAGSISFVAKYFFPRIYDSHCDRIHSSLTAVHCFESSYAGKQPVAW